MSRRSPTWPTEVVAAVVAGAFALTLPTLPALFRSSGPPMEEGFMLAFPGQVLHGRVLAFLPAAVAHRSTRWGRR